MLAVEVDGDKLETLLSSIDAGSQRARAHVADVTDGGAVHEYPQAARELDSGQIDAFFENAGIEGPADQSLPYSRFPLVVGIWLVVGLAFIAVRPGLAARIGGARARDEGLRAASA